MVERQPLPLDWGREMWCGCKIEETESGTDTTSPKEIWEDQNMERTQATREIWVPTVLEGPL